MPSPTSTTAIRRPDLGAVAYEYTMNPAALGLIGLQIMPMHPVALKAGTYPVIPKEALLKIPDTTRAPKAAYNRVTWQWTEGDYSCRDHGLEEVLEDTEREHYEGIYPSLDLEQIAIQRITAMVLRSQEKRIAAKLFNETNFAVQNVTVPWSTAATADPAGDVKTQAREIRDTCGLSPNTLVIGRKAFDEVIECDAIKDYLKYTNAHLLDTLEEQKRILAKFLGVQRVLVGDAIEDTAPEKVAANLSEIWDPSYGFLCRVTNDPRNLEDPCIGRTFLWTKDSPTETVVEQYREEQTRGDIFRVRHNTDECFVFTDCARLLGNLVA